MAVSHVHDTSASNVRFTDLFRLHYEAYSMGAATKVLAVNAAPVQYISTTGNATVRLPLAAQNGTLFVVVNNAAAAETITVTDDAGTPNTIATLAADTGGLFHLQGSAYKCLMESAAIA